MHAHMERGGSRHLDHSGVVVRQVGQLGEAVHCQDVPLGHLQRAHPQPRQAGQCEPGACGWAVEADAAAGLGPGTHQAGDPRDQLIIIPLKGGNGSVAELAGLHLLLEQDELILWAGGSGPQSSSDVTCDLKTRSHCDPPLLCGLFRSQTLSTLTVARAYAMYMHRTTTHSCPEDHNQATATISRWVRDQVRFGVHPPLGPRRRGSVLKVLGDSPLPQVRRDPYSYVSLNLRPTQAVFVDDVHYLII